MKIKVALFASARDLIGQSEIELDLPDTATVADLKRTLVDQYPDVSDLVVRSAVSVDHEFALDSTEVKPGSELALIPPVSGG